ncbi:MAG: exo-alpha-sialidase, partial [Phycisphaerales bacterium]
MSIRSLQDVVRRLMRAILFKGGCVMDGHELLRTSGQTCRASTSLRIAPTLLIAGILLLVCSSESGAAHGFSSVTTLNTNALVDDVDDVDPDIATDGNGMWIAVWSTHTPTPGPGYTVWTGEIRGAISLDNGQTWSDPFRLYMADHIVGPPAIASDGDGNWVVAFQSDKKVHYGGPSNGITVMRSNNGRNWTKSSVGPEGDYRYYPPEVASDQEGNWIVVWQSPYRYTSATDTGPDDDIFAAYSTDNGAHWTEPEAVNSLASRDSGRDMVPSVAHSGAPNDWIVAWQSTQQFVDDIDYGEDPDIFWSRRAWSSDTWSTQAVVNTDAATDHLVSYLGDVDLSPKIATDRNGEYLFVRWPAPGRLVYRLGSVSVVWVDVTDDGLPRPVFASLEGTWQDPRICGDGAIAQLVADRRGNWMGIFRVESPYFYHGVRFSSYRGGDICEVRWWELFGEDVSPESSPTGTSGVAIATDGFGNWVAVCEGDRGIAEYDIYTAHSIAPNVTSVELVGDYPPDAPLISFRVGFSQDVTGVDAGDFHPSTSGEFIIEPSLLSVSHYGSYTIVDVDTGRCGYTAPSGKCTIRLNVLDDDTVVNTDGASIGGINPGNGNFATGQVFEIEDEAPKVTSIVRTAKTGRGHPGPFTDSDLISFLVTFSEDVDGVDAKDFSLWTTDSLRGVSVTDIFGAGSSRTVWVRTSGGSGDVRLDLIDNDTIVDSVRQPLGGWGTTGFNDGSYTEGEIYVVDRSPPIAGSVESATGPYSTDRTQLTFSWFGFEDPHSGIHHYEVSLGTTSDPTAYQDWIDVGDAISHTFLPASRTFEEDKVYVCTVRAYNGLNSRLYTVQASAQVEISTTAIMFGGDIL